MPPVVQVGDADVEADVDHRLAAVDLLVVVLERLRRTACPAPACRSRSASSCRRTRPTTVPDVKSSQVVVPPKNISMCVCGSIAPGITYFPVASITLSAGDVERLADQRDGAVVDVDVADVVVGGGDDAPALDQNGHDEPTSLVGVSLCIRPPGGDRNVRRSDRERAGARASRSRAGTRAAAGGRSPSSPGGRRARGRPGRPSTKPHGTPVTGSPSRAPGRVERDQREPVVGRDRVPADRRRDDRHRRRDEQVVALESRCRSSRGPSARAQAGDVGRRRAAAARRAGARGRRRRSRRAACAATRGEPSAASGSMTSCVIVAVSSSSGSSTGSTCAPSARELLDRRCAHAATVRVGALEELRDDADPEAARASAGLRPVRGRDRLEEQRGSPRRCARAARPCRSSTDRDDAVGRHEARSTAGGPVTPQKRRGSGSSRRCRCRASPVDEVGGDRRAAAAARAAADALGVPRIARGAEVRARSSARRTRTRACSASRARSRPPRAGGRRTRRRASAHVVARTFEAAVVGMPATSITSLTATDPVERPAGARSASASASSARTEMKAL